MDQFIKRHQAMILGRLNGFDRVRFRGTIRMLAAVRGLVAWMKDQQVPIREFGGFAEEMTGRVKASVEAMAVAGGRPITYLASSALSKEDLVRELMLREGVSEGLVCVLSCVEPCRSYNLRRDRQTKTIDLVRSYRKCLHWYFYFIDSTWGLCHIRIQSWLPFTVHVCINGREWLCRELEAAGIGFQRRDNCLVDVADFTRAQQLLDAQSRAPWTRLLDALLGRSCPLLGNLPFRGERLRYYWSAEETEWASDILFRSAEQLAGLYPALLRHGMTTFSSLDVLRFLGRERRPQAERVHGGFQGVVKSRWVTGHEGVRIKHWVNANSIKMYNKEGSVLRVETTINNARDMKVYRASERDPQGEKSWRILRKGVADLPRRAQISQGANQRYLRALAGVDVPTPLGRLVDAVSVPVQPHGRRARGLNPLTGADARLASILLRGEFAISGFRNRDVRALLFPDAQDDIERRRASAKVTRLLGLFRAHGLIRKISGTHRYQLTADGTRTLPAFLAARNASIQKLNELAA